MTPAPPKPKTSDELLAEAVAQFRNDPLGFVRFAFPWGEPGELQEQAGPDEWQRELLEEIGRQCTERAFDGKSPVDPILMAVSSGHGVGKAHPMSMQIETPCGPKKWGELYPGDSVFDASGERAEVVARHERGLMPIYRVTFDDGSSTLCAGDHLWNVRGRNERRKNLPGWRTMTTAEIVASGVKRSNGTAQARQWEIPVQGEAQFCGRAIPLHPYFVGLWLGDGTKGEPQYSKPFPELAERLRGFGLDVRENVGGTVHRVNGVKHLLTDPVFQLGSPERYIPDAYKYNTAEVRRELLRGLLDSDGEAVRAGTVCYSSTSRRLIDDVIWLVRSLGGKASLHPTPKEGWYPGSDGERVECRDCYRVTIQLTWNPFTIKHRAERWKACEPRYLCRWIDSIEYSHDEAAMCITVDRPDGLYLANDFVVTHNSTIAGWLVCWIMSTRPDSQGTVTANTATQVATKTWPKIQQWMKLCITRKWFRVTSERILSVLRPETWYCSAQTCKEENVDAFQGQHAATSSSWYLFDEASGIPEGIWEAAEGGMTDGQPMLFAFGNCLRNTGKFYRAVFGSDRSVFTHKVVDARRSAIANQRLIAKWIERYGENSDFVKVRVYGLPPEASELQYIDWGRIRGACERDVPLVFDDEPLIAGVDFSGGGNAWNVVRFRRGLDGRSIPPVRIPGEKTRLDRGYFVGVLAEILRDRRPGRRVAMMFCDSAFGSPYVVRLQTMGFENVAEINFGGKSPDQHQANMRAHMAYKCKEWLIAGAIEDDGLLPYQLSLPGYHLNQKNQLVMEAKEDIVDRGEASPDDGDAFWLTFAQAVAPVTPEDVPEEEEFGHLMPSRGGSGGWMGR